MEAFGVIVICTKRDYLFAKGCCASIRYFMGDVPICLLVHGEFDYSQLQKRYNCSVINYDSIKDADLKKRSFGWGTSRFIAFWESPFETFLLIDSDTVIWGDMREYVKKFADYDLIIDKPTYSYNEADINQWFFDTEKVKKLFPDFNFLDNPYVCPGIIMSRRFIFTKEEYMKILDLQDNDPSLFFPGDMGFFNLMTQYAKQQGRLRLGNEDIQYLVCDFSPDEMKKAFPLNGKPAVTKAPTVLHFTGGIKPIRYKKLPHYTEPAMFFRRKYLEGMGIKGMLASAVLKFEDLQWTYRVQKPYYRKRIRKMFGMK
jgi:hypothetical protein